MNKTTLETNYQFFMESDVSQYIGEWIAIVDEKVIAHGRSIKEVAEKSKSLAKGKKALFARVPDKESMIF